MPSGMNIIFHVTHMHMQTLVFKRLTSRLRSVRKRLEKMSEMLSAEPESSVQASASMAVLRLGAAFVFVARDSVAVTGALATFCC